MIIKKSTENKRAVSEILSTVLLIGMVVAISVAVSSWLYIQAKNPPIPQEKCGGVSITIEKAFCNPTYPAGANLTIYLRNRGRFDIKNITIKADFQSGQSLDALYPVDLPFIVGAEKFPAVHGSNVLKPGESYNYTLLYKQFIPRIDRLKVTPITSSICDEQAQKLRMNTNCQS